MPALRLSWRSAPVSLVNWCRIAVSLINPATGRFESRLGITVIQGGSPGAKAASFTGKPAARLKAVPFHNLSGSHYFLSHSSGVWGEQTA